MSEIYNDEYNNYDCHNFNLLEINLNDYSETDIAFI